MTKKTPCHGLGLGAVRLPTARSPVMSALHVKVRCWQNSQMKHLWGNTQTIANWRYPSCVVDRILRQNLTLGDGAGLGRPSPATSSYGTVGLCCGGWIKVDLLHFRIFTLFFRTISSPDSKSHVLIRLQRKYVPAAPPSRFHGPGPQEWEHGFKFDASTTIRMRGLRWDCPCVLLCLDETRSTWSFHPTRILDFPSPPATLEFLIFRRSEVNWQSEPGLYRLNHDRSSRSHPAAMNTQSCI